MSQLFLLEFNFRNQAAVATYNGIVSSRRKRITAFGGVPQATYVDQDNANHLFHLEMWTSREQHAHYMKWSTTQLDHERLVDCLLIPPRFAWLAKLEE